MENFLPQIARPILKIVYLLKNFLQMVDEVLIIFSLSMLMESLEFNDIKQLLPNKKLTKS